MTTWKCGDCDSLFYEPNTGPNETYYCSTRGEYAYELRELAKENE